MQFPRHRVAPRIHIVGIATFADAIESSFNRIACETAPSASCLRSSPRAWVRHLARESANPRVGPLSRAWVRWYAWGRRPRAYLGVGVRVMGLTRIVSGSRATHQAVAVPTPQVTLPTTPRCQRLLPRWFALWAAPRGVTSPTVNCGTCASRGPVRDVAAGDIVTKRGELHH